MMEDFIEDDEPETPYGCLPVIAAAIILWTIVGATWWWFLFAPATS